MADLYTALQQQLHFDLTSWTLFILIGIAIVLGLIALFSQGAKRVATPGRLKWLLLHTISLVLIGYFLSNFVMNMYLMALVFAILLTLLAAGFRYVMYATKPTVKNVLTWACINTATLAFAQIIFTILHVTEPVLKLFFGAFCLTWVGTMVHGKFKE